MEKDYQIVGPFKQLLTMDKLPLKGAIADGDLKVKKNAGILIEGQQIKAIGKFEKLYKKHKKLNPRIYKLSTNCVGMPGLVDAHTHICFGGHRAHDYALRNSGMSYLEIAKSGGGIWDTVQHTRASSKLELSKGIIKRANQHLTKGITTIEVKSGYGLSVKEEIKMLKAIQFANKQSWSDLIPTCLAAHIFPKDYDGTIKQYLAEISSQLFPILKTVLNCNRIDAFIEAEAFSKKRISPYLAKAHKMGFNICIHADQFHTGGSEVAIKFGALSADHLEASGEKEIKKLAKSKVIAMALPAASLGIGCPFTPARKLLDAGASLAIASDWNPGSAPIGDLLGPAAILGSFEKLSNAEVLAGITYRAARALNLHDRGSLKAGNLADFITFPCDHFNEILYHQGQLRPNSVWKRGIRVYKLTP